MDHHFHQDSLLSGCFQVVKTFLIPFIKVEGMRLQFALERPFTTEMDRIFVEHIKNALLVSFSWGFFRPGNGGNRRKSQLKHDQFMCLNRFRQTFVSSHLVWFKNSETCQHCGCAVNVK